MSARRPSTGDGRPTRRSCSPRPRRCPSPCRSQTTAACATILKRTRMDSPPSTPRAERGSSGPSLQKPRATKPSWLPRRSGFLTARRQAARVALDRGIHRGEIQPGTDRQLPSISSRPRSNRQPDRPALRVRRRWRRAPSPRDRRLSLLQLNPRGSETSGNTCVPATRTDHPLSKTPARAAKVRPRRTPALSATDQWTTPVCAIRMRRLLPGSGMVLVGCDLEAVRGRAHIGPTAPARHRYAQLQPWSCFRPAGRSPLRTATWQTGGTSCPSYVSPRRPGCR